MVHYTVMLKVLPPILTLLPALVRKFKAALSPPMDHVIKHQCKIKGCAKFPSIQIMGECAMEAVKKRIITSKQHAKDIFMTEPHLQR